MENQKNAKKMGELTQTKEKLNELNQVKVPGAKDKAIYQSMQAKLQERGIIIGSVEYIDAGPTESSYGLYMGYTNKRGETKRDEFDICSRKLGKISNILWSWGASISPGEIEGAISHTIKNMEGSVRARRHTHLGFGTYHGEPIFKMDDSWDAAGNKISTYGSNIIFTQAGNLNDYMMGLKELVVGQPALLTTLVAGASGLVCQALNIPDSNIIVNLHGDTSIGKSTAENLALAFWGDSRTLMTNFNSTPGFWNTELKHRNIVPITVDDISASKCGYKNIGDLIFQLGSGITRGKFNEQPERYYCPVLVSSELSLVSKLLELEAQGQFFRLIELEVKRGDLTKDVKHAKKLEAFILHNYGLGAVAMGRYMVQNQLVGQHLLDLYQMQQVKIQEDKRLSGVARVGNRLAILTLTCHIMNQCFDLGIDLERFTGYLVDSVRPMFNTVNHRISTYHDFCKLVQDKPELFAGSDKNYDKNVHLGVKELNEYGNQQVLIPTRRLENLIFGVSPHQILSNTSKKEGRQPKNKEMESITRFWRDKGWLYCIKREGQNYCKRTLGITKEERAHQTLVYVVIIREEENS